jgi:hypothetical protein
MEKFLNKIFTEDEINLIEESIAEQIASRELVEWDDQVDGEYVHNSKIVKIQKNLGRFGAEGIILPDSINMKVLELVNNGLVNNNYRLTNQGVFYVEYNPKYGTPDLTPHYDGGTCTLILDYQLSSNTDWPIGIDDRLYQLSDNDGVLLKPLEYLHYRPIRSWSEGDSVRMIFFNLVNTQDPGHKARIMELYNGEETVIHRSSDFYNEV